LLLYYIYYSYHLCHCWIHQFKSPYELKATLLWYWTTAVQAVVGSIAELRLSREPAYTSLSVLPILVILLSPCAFIRADEFTAQSWPQSIMSTMTNENWSITYICTANCLTKCSLKQLIANCSGRVIFRVQWVLWNKRNEMWCVKRDSSFMLLDTYEDIDLFRTLIKYHLYHQCVFT